MILWHAVDEYIPVPQRETEKDFGRANWKTYLFSLGRGTVVTGRSRLGAVKIGEDYRNRRFGTLKTTVTVVLKCSEKKWIKDRLEITVVSLDVVLKEMLSVVCGSL